NLGGDPANPGRHRRDEQGSEPSDESVPCEYQHRSHLVGGDVRPPQVATMDRWHQSSHGTSLKSTGTSPGSSSSSRASSHFVSSSRSISARSASSSSSDTLDFPVTRFASASRSGRSVAEIFSLGIHFILPSIGSLASG